jgi:hypothetical protein
LEGGYQLDVLSNAVVNVFRDLLGQDDIQDPFGPMPQSEHDISGLLERLKRHFLSK